MLVFDRSVVVVVTFKNAKGGRVQAVISLELSLGIAESILVANQRAEVSGLASRDVLELPCDLVHNFIALVGDSSERVDVCVDRKSPSGLAGALGAT